MSTTSAARVPLGRRGRQAVLVFHVLASVGWFGIAVLVAFLLVAAEATGSPTMARGLYQSVETSVWLSVPVALAAAATGVVLGLGTKWGVARYWWVLVKEIIVVPVVVTDLLIVAPGAHDAVHGRLSGPLLDPAIAHTVVLTVATVVSLVKPFGRIRAARRDLPSRA
jgi:ABC-type spermidine/putrescine transport system permease subunit II